MDEDEARNTGRHIEDVLKAWKKLLPSLAKTIQNCKDTILFLDIPEESRDLFLDNTERRTLWMPY